MKHESDKLSPNQESSLSTPIEQFWFKGYNDYLDRKQHVFNPLLKDTKFFGYESKKQRMNTTGFQKYVKISTSTHCKNNFLQLRICLYIEETKHFMTD